MACTQQTLKPERYFRQLRAATPWSDEFPLRSETTNETIAAVLGKVASSRGEHYRAIREPDTEQPTLLRLRYPIAEPRSFNKQQWQAGSEAIASELGTEYYAGGHPTGIRVITFNSGDQARVKQQADGFRQRMPHARVAITELFDAYGGAQPVANVYPAVVLETEAISFHEANKDVVRVFSAADVLEIGRFSVEEFMHGSQGTTYTVQTRHFY